MSRPRFIGWRAERRRRALLRYGRLRAGYLVLAAQKTRASLGDTREDAPKWIADFRAEYGSDGLSDEDLALSLAYDPLKADHPTDGWPHAGIDRARQELAGLTSPEPDDVQVARELLTHPLPAPVFMLATDVITQYEDLAPLFRSRRPVDQDRLEQLRERLREMEEEGWTG